MGRYLSLSLVLLFLANAISSKAEKAESAETRVTVVEGAPLALECHLRPEQRNDWKINGEVLPTDMYEEPERPASDGRRLTVRVTATAAAPHHAGVYTCTPERDQRVRVLVQPAARPTPPAGEPPTTEATIAARAGDPTEVVFEVRGKGNFSLRCTLPNDNGAAYVWKKNDTLLENVHDLKNRYKLEHDGAQLTVPRGLEDDWGNYSCELPSGGRQRWAVRGNPYAKLPPNSNVVEGQTLKLVCKVFGKPYPTVTWWYKNSTSEGNYTEVTEALGDHVKLNRSEQGVPNGLLLVAAAARSDAGRYNCSTGVEGLGDSTELRVKDMYAALWPFLGICAEVFILCAIILVYEKRRTKPELDDSDTDNHDQKKS